MKNIIHAVVTIFVQITKKRRKVVKSMVPKRRKFLCDEQQKNCAFLIFFYNCFVKKCVFFVFFCVTLQYLSEIIMISVKNYRKRQKNAVFYKTIAEKDQKSTVFWWFTAEKESKMNEIYPNFFYVLFNLAPCFLQLFYVF